MRTTRGAIFVWLILAGWQLALAEDDPVWTYGIDWHQKDLELAAAREMQRSSPRTVKVAIIDSGAYWHPELVGHFFVPGERPVSPTNYGIDFTFPESWWEKLGLRDEKRWTPIDGDGAGYHGTHGAGLIVQIASEVQLLILKTYGGVWNVGTNQTVAKAIRVAVAAGVDIINLSTVFPNLKGGLKEALDEAMAKDILIVAAAGSSHIDDLIWGLKYPESDLEKRTEDIFLAVYQHPHLLKVGAHDYENQYLPKIFYSPRYIDVSAPGKMIYSLQEPSVLRPIQHTGSSQATFITSGMMAFLMSQYPKGLISLEEIKKIVISTSVPVPDLADKVLAGGKLNLRRALSALHQLIDLKNAESSVHPAPPTTSHQPMREVASEPARIFIPLMRERLPLHFY